MFEWSQDVGVFERGEVVKFWATKYSLTKGIIEVEADFCLDVENKPMDRIRVKNEGYSGVSVFFHKEGRDFHRTEAGALKRALEMGHKKIKAIHKQIDKLESKQAQLRNHLEEISKKA